MSKLSAVQNKTIEEFWTNIDDYRKQLKFREWELLNPHNEEDMSINVKSSKIGNPTQNKAILLSEDTRYQHLKKIVNIIETLYEELDNDLKTIVNMRYWSKGEFYEWEEISDKLYMSRNKVLRKRNLLIDETAKRIGWV